MDCYITNLYTFAVISTQLLRNHVINLLLGSFKVNKVSFFLLIENNKTSVKQNFKIVESIVTKLQSHKKLLFLILDQFLFVWSIFICLVNFYFHMFLA